MVSGKVGRPLVIRGDALHPPLRDNSVDLVCTSPPYLWKRKYAIDGTGEMGNERDWRTYLDTLFAVTDEMLRVLKPKGSIWINLGDTRVTGREPKWLGIPVKSKLLLPERYRVGCQDRYAARGVIVRQVQVWEKGNGLPESVTDRTRDSHEDWVHIVKRPRYFAALDELREPHARSWTPGHNGGKARQSLGGTMAGLPDAPAHPLGALPGSVWSIPSEPLRLPPWIDTQHYAAFPTEWPRRLILGFTPHLICGVCKIGRFPVVERRNEVTQHAITATYKAPDNRRSELIADRMRTEATILGYACACTPYTDHPGIGGSDLKSDYSDGAGRGNFPWIGDPKRQNAGPRREYHLDQWTPPPGHPATVLDPFGGTGTVAHVARALGRHAISIDLSEPYCRLAADATLARQRAGKVLGRVHLERQGTLL